jgi:hypothetical protein
LSQRRRTEVSRPPEYATTIFIGVGIRQRRGNGESFFSEARRFLMAHAEA